MSAALEASGLGKRYRRTWALRDCTLTIPRGRIAALVGPNGAGKTTLLHLAVGLLAPTTGSIRVLGQVPGGPGLLAQVGFVAQDTPLYRDFTVDRAPDHGRQAQPPLRPAPGPRRLERLGDPARTAASAPLSGGQRAQVALALALAKRAGAAAAGRAGGQPGPAGPARVPPGAHGQRGRAGHDRAAVLAPAGRPGTGLRLPDRAARPPTCRCSGPVDELLEQHKLLVGPCRERHRRSPAWPRWCGPATPTGRPPCWSAPTARSPTRPGPSHAVTLEDLVLAYLADPSAGALPGPSVPTGSLNARR